MESIDDETVAVAKRFIKEQVDAGGKPFFTWWNGTRMHFRTHVKEERRHSGNDEYTDGMIEHDMHVGQLLDYLDELGIADNTIVFYSTDNGPHFNTWPDAGTTPFHGEKNTSWEGAFRSPAFIKWPGKFPARENPEWNLFSMKIGYLPSPLLRGLMILLINLKKGMTLNGRQYKNYIERSEPIGLSDGKIRGICTQGLYLM